MRGGVKVDGCLRSSDPHIYAVGEVASYEGGRLGRARRSCSASACAVAGWVQWFGRLLLRGVVVLVIVLLLFCEWLCFCFLDVLVSLLVIVVVLPLFLEAKCLSD